MANDVWMYEESAKARRPIEGRERTLKETTKKAKEGISQSCRARHNAYQKKEVLAGRDPLSLAKWAAINC